MCNIVRLREKCATLVIAALSLATAYYVQYAVPQDTRLYYTMSVSPLLVAILLFLLYRKGYVEFRKEITKDKAEFALSSILGLIFSAFIIEGAQLRGGVFVPIAGSLLIAIALCSLPITIALLFMWRSAPLEKATSFSTAVDYKWAFCIFFILLLCWLPWYFAAFPGLFCYNMGEINGEWGQYASGGLTTHFPVFHTILSGVVVDFGRNFFGDGVGINPGVALLTALQCLAIAVIFTFCTCWMREHGAKRIIVYGAVVYFALNPVTSVFIVCTTRDVLFSAVALLVALFSYDVLDEPRKGKKSISSFVGLALSCIFLCLLRNNGLYSFVLLAVVLVILGRRKILIFGTCALVVIFSFLWFGSIYEILGVEKEANQQKEALALPIQQLAYVSSSGKLSDEEMSILGGAGYAFPSVEDYFPKISDPSKFTIVDMDLEDLVRAYILIGINHPADYMYAELARTQDLWSPYSYINCYNGFIDQVAGKDTSFFSTTINSPGSAQSLIPELSEFMHRLGGELFFQSVPLASLLVSVPFYFIAMLIVLFRATMIRSRMIFGAVSAFAALVIGAYFGPCILPRYFMYLFFGLPLMVFFLTRQDYVN